MNNYKYKLGSCSFGTKEAKEAWILEGVVMDITYILTHSKKQLGVTEKSLLKISKRNLNSLIKQKRKISVKKIKDYTK